MEEPIILYCELCNPEQLYQEDRRETKEHSFEAKIIPFPNNKRRPKPDRRQVLDRRVTIVDSPANKTALKRSKGRRPFDGHLWFVGTVENAAKEQWHIQDEGERVVCPRCLRNNR
jgi:hypothetical protein